jgi:hypothetical protein
MPTACFSADTKRSANPGQKAPKRKSFEEVNPDVPIKHKMRSRDLGKSFRLYDPVPEGNM